MRRIFSRTAIGALVSIAAFGPSCKAPPAPGEVMVVVKTDLSLPKDVDKVTIQVLVRGDTRFNQSFEKLGAEDSLKIPASLGITLAEGSDAATPFTFRVTAFQEGKPRILREAVSTVPGTRLASLSLPVQWLCWDQVQVDTEGNTSSTCPDGQTCVAGACADKKVDATKLPDYDAASTFGGGSGSGDGSCFDTTTCFANSADSGVDLTTCTFTKAGSFNAAIRVESAGICGPAGCFVPLDANSDTGWKRNPDGAVQLPQAVCDKITSGQAGGVSLAPAAVGCPLKTESLPTCGPWSSAGTPPPTPGSTTPVAMASGQDGPVAFAIVGTTLYWTNRGTADKPTGAIKIGSTNGGAVRTLLGGQGFPNDLAVDLASGPTLYWANAIATSAGAASGTIQGLDLTTPASPLPVTITSPSFQSPTGVGLFGKTLYVADQNAAGVYSIDLGAKTRVATPIADTANGLPQSNPYRIASDGTLIFWTNEGTGVDGSIVTSSVSDFTPVEVATNLELPRNLVLDRDTNGKTTAIYWANVALLSSAPSAVMKVTVDESKTPAAFGAATPFASGQAHPYGIAVDDASAGAAGNVYWTNNGDGTVMMQSKQGGAPTKIAEGQNGPGAIAVDATNVYWINEGRTGQKEGALMRIAKPVP